MALFQDIKTGQRVASVGARQQDEPFLMVRPSDGQPYWAHIDQLTPIDEATGALQPDADRGPAAAEPDLPIPTPTVPLVETRLNLNTASAELIAQRVPGISYRVAKRIKDLQLTLPNEKFAEMEQIKAASSTLNWPAVLESNSFFLA